MSAEPAKMSVGHDGGVRGGQAGAAEHNERASELASSRPRSRYSSLRVRDRRTGMDPGRKGETIRWKDNRFRGLVGPCRGQQAEATVVTVVKGFTML